MALIIGFSILMLAAVLLSDHFSPARRDNKLVNMTAVPAPGISLPGDVVSKPLPPEKDLVPPGVTGAKLPGNGEVLPAKFKEPLAGVERDVIVDPPVTPEPVNPKGLPVSKGREESYTLKADDGLYKVCVKFYSEGSLYKSLADYNKISAKELTTLAAGKVIKVPPKDVLKGEAVLGPAGLDVAGGSVKRDDTKPKQETSLLPPEDTTKPKTGKSYTVIDGDTGAKIATKALGDKERWREIEKLNPGVDARKLKIGQELKLPAK